MPDAGTQPPARANRDEVLRAGSGLLRRRGLARLDLDDVAGTLGVEPGAVRYWFDEELDLLLAIMEVRQTWFLDQARARMAPLGSHVERLRALIELCVDDYDVTYWIELWKAALRDGRAVSARERMTGVYRDQFARTIRAGQRAGEFAPVPPDRTAAVMVALVTGLSVRATLGDEGAAERARWTLIETAERMLEVELG